MSQLEEGALEGPNPYQMADIDAQSETLAIQLEGCDEVFNFETMSNSALSQIAYEDAFPDLLMRRGGEDCDSQSYRQQTVCDESCYMSESSQKEMNTSVSKMINTDSDQIDVISTA